MKLTKEILLDLYNKYKDQGFVVGLVADEDLDLIKDFDFKFYRHF